MTDRAAAALDKVAALLEDPARWTRGAAARNKLGLAVDTFSRSATSWCLVGAVQRCCGADGALAFLVVGALECHMPDEVGVLECWNDSVMRTHDEVLDLVDTARKAMRND